MKVSSTYVLLSAMFVTAGMIIGCGQAKMAAPAPKETAKAHADHPGHKDGDDQAVAGKTTEHDHSGWWCNEHGVPEEECGRCSAKAAADFQKKGDWCKEHDRPDSQCFICHPEKEQVFAAKYEAKYGKKPPKPELN